MNVAVVAEGLDQVLIAAEMGEKPQLDLGIVAGEDAVMLRVGRHEGGTDLFADFGADGDILQIRVAGTQAGRWR